MDLNFWVYKVIPELKLIHKGYNSNIETFMEFWFATNTLFSLKWKTVD
jgi:hypothetical protein